MPRKNKRPKRFKRRLKKWVTGRFQDPLAVKWSKDVKTRDGYKCQMPSCRKLCKKMQAHHIIRWADNPWLRYVITNGITLCKDCHEQITGQEHCYVELFLFIARKNGNEIPS